MQSVPDDQSVKLDHYRGRNRDLEGEYMTRQPHGTSSANTLVPGTVFPNGGNNANINESRSSAAQIFERAARLNRRDSLISADAERSESQDASPAAEVNGKMGAPSSAGQSDYFSAPRRSSERTRKPKVLLDL